MSTSNPEALSSIREKLRPFAALSEVFEECVRRLTTRDDIGIAVSGSLSHGTPDRYSDLDLELVARPGTKLDEVKHWVVKEIRAVAPLLAHFTATHLGLNDLLIFFLNQGGEVIKVDIWVMEVNTFARFPDARIVYDPGDFLHRFRLTAAGRAQASAPDFADLHQKFTGWVWYTYTKIARGELFEAANSLETMRSYALMPFLQLAEGLPFEGYRHAEERLSPLRIESLRRTVPAGLETGELIRALRSMALELIELQPLFIEKLEAPFPLADLENMVRMLAPPRDPHEDGD